jgi:hypothetical protein
MSKGKLRLLVTQRLSGSIDGIRLDRFQPGAVYEVGSTLGAYLLAVGAAEPVEDDTPAEAPAPERQLFGPIVQGHAYTVPRLVPHQAADRPRKKRKKAT